MSAVFGMYESTAFAKALARDNGVKVEQVNEAVEPHIVGRRTIMIGQPTIYGHARYMEQLHSELSKVLDGVQFFFDVKYPEESLGAVVKNILHAQRSEYEMQGEFGGRDKILRDRYNRRVSESGGIENVCRQVGALHPTLGALMYLDSEIRSDWQTEHWGDCPSELESEVNRLRPIVKDRWLSLETVDELKQLIDDICTEEQQPQGGEGDGESGSSEGNQSGQGNGAAGEGGSREGDSQAGQGAGESSEDSSSDGAGGDSDGREQSSSGTGQDSEGEGQPSSDQGGTGGGSSNQAGGSPEGDKQGQGFSIEEGWDDSKKEGEGGRGAESHVGGGPASSLKKMGLVQDALQHPEMDYQMSEVQYVPAGEDNFRIKRIYDRKQGDSYQHGMTNSMSIMMNTFQLSKRIRKYLISVSQVGYEYGLTRGKLSSKSISKIYTTPPMSQPRIFKEKQASRIKTDTAIFLLGDCSGSMSGSKYTTSACCQIACSETLQALKISHAMAQFTSHGDRIHHFYMKHFEEPFVSRDELMKRFSDDRVEMGCNADGESVVWAATELAKRKEKNKILIVLSDGKPAFRPGSPRFLGDVIRDIRDNSNMNLLGIGIKSTAVKEYYPEYRVVNRLEDLETVMIELLRSKVMK